MTPTSADENNAASRRAKKRELDRRAQRAARERNRNRIAHLEETIEAMKAHDSTNKAADLMDQLALVKLERDRLAETLQSISDLAGRHGCSLPKAAEPAQLGGDQGGQQAMGESRVASPIPSAESFVEGLAIESNLNLQSIASPLLGAGHSRTQPVAEANVQLDLDSETLPIFSVSDGLILPEPLGVCDCILPPATVGVTSSSDTADSSIWKSANQILGLNPSLPQSTLRIEDKTSEDLPVRAILRGWNSFDSGDLPPLWQILRQTDTLQFRGCRDVERLAIMVMMHRILRCQADTSNERWKKLPPWLQGRPSQMLPHSPAVDFFVWPGVRERFVFFQHRYCSNTFWKVFAESFRLLWPFEFRDCYQRNVMTGAYSLSPAFESRLYDINCWAMTNDFFYHFSDFRSDIPHAQNITSLQFRHQPDSEDSGQQSNNSSSYLLDTMF
ncbi:unnamed protein product [Clonostachys rosea f. rosea IK726]|uniref:Uncharacterized protein n=1 Tax=Clonostachys rosea f. rosea IK726 TaxID=1349383 RepID=A0ACA9UV07_BIOOC|nr:unnamed protein product [Clonostachys rosea f. rosea IK726]